MRMAGRIRLGKHSGRYGEACDGVGGHQSVMYARYDNVKSSRTIQRYEAGVCDVRKR